MAYRVGRGYAQFLSPRRIVVGRDIRLSSAGLTDALCRGLADSGVDVDDIGVCGTEGVYFATFDGGYDGGIMVTASHNPPDYNGMKFVREQSKPISGDNGLKDIQANANAGDFPAATRRGERRATDTSAPYVAHLLSYVDRPTLKPLKIVVNAGNGGAGLVIDSSSRTCRSSSSRCTTSRTAAFRTASPIRCWRRTVHRPSRRSAVRAPTSALPGTGTSTAAFCSTRQGGFIEGYYIVGLLASVLLRGEPGGRVVHDPRLTWNTIEIVEASGGTAVLSKSGHAFIKQRMREVDGVYGGEMSAHHYFRRFAYCDSGMIPWLLVAQRICESGQPLAQLVGERMAMFPVSGELNYRVPDARAASAAVEARYAPQALRIDRTDGLSCEYPTWRFNLRSSNTEPLLRLNVEARGSVALMRARTDELLGFLRSQGAVAADA